MSAESLHGILTAKRAEILSAISPFPGTPQLRTLQDAALSYILSALKDEGVSASDAELTAAASDTFSDDFQAFCSAAGCKLARKPFLIEDIKSAIEQLDGL